MGDDIARGVKDVATYFLPPEVLFGIVILGIIVLFIYSKISNDDDIKFH